MSMEKIPEAQQNLVKERDKHYSLVKYEEQLENAAF